MKLFPCLVLATGLAGAQTDLTAVYTTADASDCAGGASCIKSVGAVDGINASYTLRGLPTGIGSIKVFRNGIRQRRNGKDAAGAVIKADYQITIAASGAATILFNVPPEADDTLDFDYRENVKSNVLPQ